MKQIHKFTDKFIESQITQETSLSPGMSLG